MTRDYEETTDGKSVYLLQFYGIITHSFLRKSTQVSLQQIELFAIWPERRNSSALNLFAICNYKLFMKHKFYSVFVHRRVKNLKLSAPDEKLEKSVLPRKLRVSFVKCLN